MTREQEIRAVIQPGDIILSRVPGSLISDTIQDLTNSKWSHALLYLGDNKIIEATNHGIVINPLIKYFSNKYQIGVFRISPELTPEETTQLIKAIRKKLGIDYGWLKLAWLGFLRLVGKSEDPDWSVKLKGGMICSELVAWSYKQIGRPLKDLPVQLMEPQDLAQSKFLHRVI